MIDMAAARVERIELTVFVDAVRRPAVACNKYGAHTGNRRRGKMRRLPQR